MPTPANKLSKNSSMGEIRAAITASISKLIDEGRPREQAIAIAIGQAEKASGKTLPRRG